jgi:hypothetical protein
LKGQDIGKVIVVIGIVVGVGLLTLGTLLGPTSTLGMTLMSAADYLKSVILT